MPMPSQRASLLAIGDEILAGLTADTNTGFIAQALRSVGVEVVSLQGVADDESAIARALVRAAADAELVVTTGGLGPTSDDLTTTCVARFAGRPLRLHEESLAAIEDRFRARGLAMPSNNRKQAMIPDGASVLDNEIGTAPGFICPAESGDRAVHVVSLPGVPTEMRRMTEQRLLPWIVARSDGLRYASRVFSTVGLTESALDERLAGLVDDEDARLSFRAAFPRLQARVTVFGGEGDDLEARLNRLERVARGRLGEHIFASGDVGLEETLGALLTERGLTLAVAESCTGGLIAHRLTEAPGSSAYLLAGIVAYANQAKSELLGVSPATLLRHGAVSEQVALEMARGARARTGAAIAAATTGIAGPGGGSPEKPVGTVWVAVAWEGGEAAECHTFGFRSRSWVKEMSALATLDRLRRVVLGMPPEAGGTRPSEPKGR